MKVKVFGIFIFISLLFPPFLVHTGDTWKLCPLPLEETEKILSRWLTNSGFEIFRVSLGDGHVQLKGLKGNESWQVVLRPHSPLASSLQAKYTRKGQPDPGKLEELWTYLKNYTRKTHPAKEISGDSGPAPVLYQSASVVCLKAQVQDKPVHFSGFIVDQGGLIISTAHDLIGLQEIFVILSSGQELPGRVVKMDHLRDLVLIEVNLKLHTSLALAKGRNLLRGGERVYMIGCPLQGQRKIHTGIISGSLWQVENLPLWQVDMEIFSGSSGSPVFDAQGNLVGVVKGRFRGNPTVGFLIPWKTIIDFLRPG